VKNFMIEAETLRTLIDTMILPACFAYHGHLAAGMAAAKSAGIAAPQADSAARISELLGALQKKRKALDQAIHAAESIESEEAKGRAFSSVVASAMLDARALCDELESVVADDYWPLPKYREMLFLA
jgi:glutamine synthetase